MTNEDHSVRSAATRRFTGAGLVVIVLLVALLGGWCSVAGSSVTGLSWQTPGALSPDLEDLL
jgi:hypothetical protein